MRTNQTLILAIALHSLAAVAAAGAWYPGQDQGAPAKVAALSEEFKAGLLLMREEEKLARDVYQTLEKQWGLRPFGNIAMAEQAHMDAVKALLTRYGVADPAADTKPGEFRDPKMKALFAELTKAGKESRVAALRVGAKIEDLDLYDLKRLAKTSLPKDIRDTYDYLALGSRNHLRAFMRNLSRSGGTYEPAFLTKAEFEAILASPQERGYRGGGGR